MSKPQRPLRPLALPPVRFFHRFEEPSSVTRRRLGGSKHWEKVPTPELARRLAQIIEELVARSGPKDAMASGRFLREINGGVAALGGMARRHLDAWKQLAHKCVQWPMRVTLNPRITKSQKQLLLSLELGRDAFLSMNLR